MDNSSSKQLDDQKQKKICLPAETWTDVLSFIPRIELAQTVSLTNWLFNEISRPFIDKHNKRIVPSLRFENDGNGMAILQLIISRLVRRQIPIAQVPPPINILGFKDLDFWYINDRVLEFMRLIKPMLGTNVRLAVFLWRFNENCFHLCDIIRGNVSKLVIMQGDFNLLNMEFLKTIQFVQIFALGNPIDGHILEWIHSPLDGNKPRYVYIAFQIDINYMVETCKERFSESTVPVSFVFHFYIYNINRVPTSFSIENHQTGEQLTLGWYHDGGNSYFMLCRSKIGDDQGWRQIMEDVNNKDNQTKLCINL